MRIRTNVKAGARFANRRENPRRGLKVKTGVRAGWWTGYFIWVGGW